MGLYSLHPLAASTAFPQAAFAQDAGFIADAFSEQRFLDAMTVVLAHAMYLPAAQCFALVPGLHGDLRSWDVSLL